MTVVPGSPHEPEPWRRQYKVGDQANGYILAPDGWVASPDTVRSALALATAQQTVTGGVVAQQGDTWAVVVGMNPGEQVNHVLHAILTILLCGLWGIVWIILSISAQKPAPYTVRIDIDYMGRPMITRLQ